MITNFNGVSGSRISFLVSRQLAEFNKALVVVSNAYAAAGLAEDLAFFVPEANVVVMPEAEDVHIMYEARNRESLIQRLKGIQALCAGNSHKGEPTVVIAPVSAAVRKTEAPSRFKDSIFRIETGDVLDPADFRRMLTQAGYNSSAVAESPGEFSSRGGIIDVFPASYENPVRIEFFGDEVDSLRSYDKDTQRTIENIFSVVIGPAAEFIPTPEEKQKAIVRIRRDIDRKIKSTRSNYADKAVAEDIISKLEASKGRLTDLFEEQSNVQIFADYLDYFDIEKCRLWDYAGDGLVIVRDPARLEDTLTEAYTKEDFREIYACRNLAIFTPFPERIQGLEKLDRIVNVKSRQIAPFNGQIDLFAQEIGKLVQNGYQITVVSSDDERNERIKEYLDIAEIEGNISYRAGNLTSGFIMDDEKTCFITESDIFSNTARPAGSRRKPAKRPNKKTAETIQFSDLHAGDYVVHEVHGIGRFEGIRTMTADGITRDYLVIRYAGSDVLYIPTEQLDIIQKYIGNSGNAPALSRLSGGTWRRTRERARKAAMAIAEDLVKLYAERQAAGGHAFGKDTLWQQEFEADFPYVETDDQLRATEEIKEDMQKPLPMDRLLCGDVGYGKTEVAARAIFKCISEGKQAAILAPTTLLVNQHYNNLKERFENFPFEIEELSRFRSAAAQKRICNDLKEGQIDLIIGTHRILSEDVRFKDLGLLVIDEEQRFGVRHKEKIKMLRKNIDVLTLSATPIPRTLNMSLAGIKDISIIEEPPQDRLPVHTYVTPYEEDILKNAIERELSRGGQVFVVNNRITGLTQIKETVERLVPNAVCVIGHGRMGEESLEMTMLDFVEGRANVLIATTIIENGIDIPNANTMVILNSDKFGLAQLYQLRGRVGRSHRLAYAYLMYHPNRVLTEIARKRLTAIREFTEFGAGFKLAMRDLEMRGAGNMLGEAQSGHIESIGYELYCKEIDRAVRKLKGETVTEERADIKIELPMQASIPAAYITDETLRLQAYKKMAGITSQDDAEDLSDELLDRYGDVPDETMSLLKIAEIRAHAERIGAINITRRDKNIVIKFAGVNRFNAYAAVMAKADFGDSLVISSGRITTLSLFTGKTIDLDKLLKLMRILRVASEETSTNQTAHNV
ncbi:MAG: transcription-repair coupling factor [Mogibacterium sp.]|nr:transcription-repair coupling factor [Mogibacterium sp.]